MSRKFLPIASISVLLILVSGLIAQPVIIPVYPDDGESVVPEDFMLIASVIEDKGAESLKTVDWEKGVELLLDDQPLSPEVLGGTIRWVPSGDFLSQKNTPGGHRASLTLKDLSGGTVASVQWNFTILKTNEVAPEDRPAKTSGSRRNGRVFMEARHYNLANDTAFDFITGALFRGGRGKVRYTGNVLISNLEDAQSQYRNIYTAEIGYSNWLEIKAGDTRPHWDDIVLSGERLRGVELNTRLILPSGKNPINLDICFGNTRRAVEMDTTGDNYWLWNYGTFERSVFAVRPSFGSGKRFKAGFTFLRGRDDSASIQMLDSIPVVTGTDTVLVRSTTPEDNLVFGGDFVVRFFERHLEVFGNYALSIHTKNTLGGPIIPESLGVYSPIDFEKISGIAILNASSSPANTNGTSVFNASMFTTGAEWRRLFGSARNTLRFEYELKGANYYSMGNPLTGTARQGFTLTETIAAIKDRMVLQADYSRFSNNLDGLQEAPTIAQTIGAQASLFFAPHVPGITFGFTRNSSENSGSGYGFTNGANMFFATTSYNYLVGEYKGRLRLFTNWSGISNEWSANSFDSTGRVSQTNTTALSTGLYGVSGTTRMPSLPLELITGFMTNRGSDTFMRFYSGTLGAGYRIIPQKLRADLSAVIKNTRFPGNTGSQNNISMRYGLDYAFAMRHSAVFNGSYMSGAERPDLMNTLKYEWRF